VAYAAVLLV